MSLFAFIIISVPLILIGSAMAFLITWHEYQKHKFEGKRLFMEAFQTALFTFFVFLILMLAAGFLLSLYALK